MDKHTLLEKKIKYLIKELEKKETPTQSLDKINLTVDSIIDYISDNFDNYDFFLSFDLLIDKLTNIKEDNREYFDTIVKNIYNKYFKLSNMDSFIVWSILIFKRFYSKIGINYTAIYGYYFYLFLYNDKMDYTCEELEFPLKDFVSLFDVLKEFEKNILQENILSSYQPSYNLFFQPILSDKLFFYMNDFFTKNNRINIWFPFAGIGIEPLYFASLFSITKDKDNISGNFNIYCSATDVNVLQQGLKLPQIRSRIEEEREVFIQRNKIVKSNNLKSLIKIKKRVFVNNFEEMLLDNTIKKINFIFLAVKQEGENWQKNIPKLLKNFKGVNENCFIIIEAESSFKFEITNKKFADFVLLDIVAEEFISELKDKYLTYLIFRLIDNPKVKTTSHLSEFSIELLYEESISKSTDEIKKTLKSLKFDSIKNRDALLIAELLTKIGKYSKAFEFIKDYFVSDYTLSYDILKNILHLSNNKKLTKRISFFIEKNKLKEYSFSAELFSVVTDEIDKYFLENPDSNLNAKKWL